MYTATQTALAGKLDKSGGTMSGNLAMGSNRITGLADGLNPNDAVTKAQMEAAIVLDTITYNENTHTITVPSTRGTYADGTITFTS